MSHKVKGQSFPSYIRHQLKTYSNRDNIYYSLRQLERRTVSIRKKKIRKKKFPSLPLKTLTPPLTGSITTN